MTTQQREMLAKLTRIDPDVVLRVASRSCVGVSYTSRRKIGRARQLLITAFGNKVAMNMVEEAQRNG